MEATRPVSAGGLVLTLVAMTIALVVVTLLVYGSQYVSIGLYIAPVSTRDLQLALSRAVALPVALYLGARLASAGPQHGTQAMLAALGTELFAVVALGWWRGAHSLVLPVILLSCVIGVLVAREGARAGAPPYPTH